MSDQAKLVGSERVLAVLIELAKHTDGVSLDDLSLKMQASKPTIHRALTSLRKAGLADQIARGIYVLGDEFLRMAYRFQDRRPEAVLFDAALSALSVRFGETVHLAVLDGKEVVYRGKVDAPSGAVKLTSSIGARNPAYATAVGKTLLAFMFEREVDFNEWLGEEPLERRTDFTITDKSALWRELQLTRSRGYGVDNQENEVGINCLAIPVFVGGNPMPYASISVSGLAFRTSLQSLEARFSELEELVKSSVSHQ